MHGKTMNIAVKKLKEYICNFFEVETNFGNRKTTINSIPTKSIKFETSSVKICLSFGLIAILYQPWFYFWTMTFHNICWISEYGLNVILFNIHSMFVPSLFHSNKSKQKFHLQSFNSMGIFLSMCMFVYFFFLFW